jgi:hypothetical protein
MPYTRSPTPPGRPRRPQFTDPDDPLGLFGDGPPTWTINKGKPGQRPSFSAGEAMRQRDATALKLGWHANHVASAAGNETTTSIAAWALADKLDACAPSRNPCLSGADPVCMRAQQRWFVNDTVHLLRPGVRRGYRAKVLSLVPEWGLIPAGSLNTFDIDKFLDAIRAALKACGIDHYKLGLDVSLNQRAGSTSPRFWQLQLWGFFHEPKTPWRTQLKALLNPNGGVTRPVKVVKPTSLEAAAAYGFRTSRVLSESERRSRGSRGVLEHARSAPAR